MAAITFNIYFEEVWDFYLTFMDWKATNLLKEDDKQLAICPSVQLTLLSHQALEKVSESATLKNAKLPHWALFN